MAGSPGRADDAPIELSDHCPPYFSTDTDGKCRLSSIYDMYPAAHPQWGGYRVALPERRDGFTAQQIDLGRYLFFDPVLSGDETLSCAHCHHPDYSLSDGRARSMGRSGIGLGPHRTGGEDLPRGAPSLWNLAFAQTFFWDSRADSLEEQIEVVLTTPEEMDTTPEAVIVRLNGIRNYRTLFSEAFGEQPITFQQVQSALVAFETSLVSLNSRYDNYIHGQNNALNEQEISGLHVFRSFASRCSQCHTPPLFTSGQVATTGVPTPKDLPFDKGAEVPMNEPTLRGAFKVPSLRNIAKAAPYMHAGQSRTLLEAISFYNDTPGHAVSGQRDLRLHWHLVDPNLTSAEVQDLAAFLNTLTDETALPKIPNHLPSGHPVPRNVQVVQTTGDSNATY
jgi:cytochrome c peroxidase